MNKISIAFLDDHPVLLTGICQLFAAGHDMTVIATGRTADDVLDVAMNMRPNVMVVDINMPGNVLAAIARATSMNLPTRFLAFTASDSVDTAIAALEAGALGYLLKGATLDELGDAIRRVNQGETYIAPAFASRVVTALRRAQETQKVPRVRFSPREEEVLRLLLRGGTNREIADALNISEKTVKHYMTILIQKLNVRNRVEVVLAAQVLADSGGLSRQAIQERRPN
ncbi:MAG: LuxR C-terminal-related transcriptional regulator [Tabrizicola flagellatus]|uniref:LuxR C-terminal-related transcriptional regulator n=1 Tax=Tabrizicola flagellatus TaxID=2593021 RepID=UPI00391A8E3E